MALSNSTKQEIFDPVRNRWVAALPEELVRQKLLQKMMGQLGFPRAYLAIEKELKELSRYRTRSDLTGCGVKRTLESPPERRVDIVCFAPDTHSDCSFSPLLLVECKEKLVFKSASEQLFGYNQYVEAPFLLLADEREVRFSYTTATGRQWLPFLPKYQELLDALRR